MKTAACRRILQAFALAVIAVHVAGCESGPQIRQTRVLVSEVEIRKVPSGTLFESAELSRRRREATEPMTLNTRSRIADSMNRETRILRGDTKVRVLYRGTYRALVLLRGGERGYVPVSSLEDLLPPSAFEVGNQPKIAGKGYRDKPAASMQELEFDTHLDVFVDQALIDEVNRQMPLPAPQ